MGDNRATAERRVDVRIQATFVLDDKPYACSVMNMSANGLLLRFDGQPDLLPTDEETGKTGTLVFGAGEAVEKTLQGKIVRFLSSDGIQIAAVSVVGS